MPGSGRRPSFCLVSTCLWFGFHWCSHTYLHGFVRRQEWSGTEKKQLLPGCIHPRYTPQASPVSISPYTVENQTVAGWLQWLMCSTQINMSQKVLVNIAMKFASETVWRTTFLHPLARQSDWKLLIVYSVVCPGPSSPPAFSPRVLQKPHVQYSWQRAFTGGQALCRTVQNVCKT